MNRKTENFLPLPHYYAHFQKVSIFLHYGTAQMHRFGKCTIFMHNQAEKCGEMWHKTISLLFCRKAYFVSTKILKRLSLGGKHLSMKMEKTLKGPNLIFHAVRSKKSDIGRNIRYSLCCQNGSSRIPIANFAE